MKILYDYRTFIRQRRGGISRYFYEIIRRGAANEGNDVYLFQGLHINDFDMSRETALAGYFGIHHRKIPKSGPALEIINNLLMKAWLATNSRRYDIYHPTYYGFPRPGCAKTVVTIYDMIHELFPEKLSGAKSVTAVKKAALRQADAVLAISEHTKKDAAEIFGVSPAKISVTSLAASDTFRPASIDEINAFKASGYVPVGPYVLYVGDRGSYKNFPALIKALGAAERLKELNIVCAGGNAAPSRSERDIIDAWDMSQKVVFKGSVKDETLRMLYAGAQCHVATSLYEGFGLTVLEAMKCGTPVVCARSSSLPEVAGEAALYFDPSSPDELADRLQKLMSDGALRAKFITAGLLQSEKFGWDKTAAETMAVYDKLLS